jgi:hypothetical protein
MQSESLDAPDDLREASGVTRWGEELLIVTDAHPGVYFRVPIKGAEGPIILFSNGAARRQALTGAQFAVDFESIDVLADARIVALSERLRSLVGENGLITQYDDPLSEIGERGLEGLAVRRNGDGSSQVAVLWEGGYIEDAELQPQLRVRVQPKPLLPVIFTHPIAPRETGFKLKIDSDSELVELQVPLPDKDENGWRFRAPDLVWHSWSGDGSGVQNGLIVLLNSQLPRRRPDKAKFGPCWLQRFTTDGSLAGDPINLDDVCGATLKGANWEGLGWFEEGRRLIMVHDQSKNVAEASALIVDIPVSWMLRSDS